MENLYEKVREASNYIQNKMGMFEPNYGIILGTGLGNLVNDIDILCEITYGEIPHFPVSTVHGHAGKLVVGTLDGRTVAAMAGRFHYYEGYSMKEVTFPVRVLGSFGIKRLIVSNASGSVNPDIEEGDVVFMDDHINLFPDNPLRGANDERMGIRFPDMLRAYDRELNQKAMEIAKKHNIRAHRGVYAGTAGPNLETPAEYRYFNIIGADLVGMSTVPEVIVAKHMDLPVFAASVVSNKCFPIEDITETTHEYVVETVSAAGARLTIVLKELMNDPRF